MEESFVQDSVRNRLILSGLKELDKHGVVDFSLRRVAIDAGVSCAAPYRHFEDKDELIRAIISYVMEGWTLLSAQIKEIYSSDVKSGVVELAVAGLRFWIGNGNFRTVIMSASTLDGRDRTEMRTFEFPISLAVEEFCSSHQRTDSAYLTFKILSMIYGAVMLVDGGYESSDNAAASLHAALSEML